jgi:hypothetical protein
LILYPLCIFENKNIKRVGVIISVVIIIGASAVGFANRNDYYETTLRVSGGDGITFDDTYTVYFEDEKYGDVTIEHDKRGYIVNARFVKTGETTLVIESPQGEQVKFDLTIGSDTYELEKIE